MNRKGVRLPPGEIIHNKLAVGLLSRSMSGCVAGERLDPGSSWLRTTSDELWTTSRTTPMRGGLERDGAAW
ncbi:hypothetical protein Droror1_Dr00017755, partial [Drosera rotundifolia]